LSKALPLEVRNIVEPTRESDGRVVLRKAKRTAESISPEPIKTMLRKRGEQLFEPCGEKPQERSEHASLRQKKERN